MFRKLIFHWNSNQTCHVAGGPQTFAQHGICVFLLLVRCNHHCESSRDMERGLGMGLPMRDSTPPVMDNILHEVSSIRQFLEKREASREIAKEWLQVGYVLDVLLFRVYLLAMLAYSITLGTLWSVWQYA